jgi:HEAT repeat protein
MTPLQVFFKTLSKTSAIFLGAAIVFLNPPLEWGTRAVTASKSPSQMAIDSLVHALNDPDPKVRLEAADALNGWRRAATRRGAQNAVRDLIAQLGSSDATARAKAACELREREGEAAPAVDALVALLADAAPVDQAVCGRNRWRNGRICPTSPGEQAASALAAIGSRSVDPLLKATTDANDVVRMNAAWALGTIGDNRAVDALLVLLKDPSARVRRQAAWAVGALSK